MCRIYCTSFALLLLLVGWLWLLLVLVFCVRSYCRKHYLWMHADASNLSQPASGNGRGQLSAAAIVADAAEKETD